MRKILFYTYFFLTMFEYTFASEKPLLINIADLNHYLKENSYETKRSEFAYEEKKLLTQSPWSYFIPEVTLFGGIKSHDQELEFEEKHFFGLRSSYTLLDGGEKKLNYKISHLDFQEARLEKEITLGKEGFEILTLLIKEVGLNEKLELLKDQEIKLEEISRKTKEKVRAGVLSAIESLTVGTKVKEIENYKLEIQEELSLILLEKRKKLYLNEKVSEENLSLKENLEEALLYLKKNNLSQSQERAKYEKNKISLEKSKLHTENDSNFLKPELKLFLEKGITRTVEGEHLEEGGSDRLVFGLEFELPLIHEAGKNFKEIYAAKTRQKIIEMENNKLSSDFEINKKINLKQVELKQLSLDRQISISKLKLNELNMKQKSVNSGLVEFPDYVESLVEWIEARLREFDKKEALALAYLNLQNETQEGALH